MMMSGALPAPAPAATTALMTASATPSRALTSAPATPSRPAQGALRADPCLGCLRSALAGRSNGQCHNATTGSRCWKCASGHVYAPVPVSVLPIAWRLVTSLVSREDYMVCLIILSR